MLGKKEDSVRVGTQGTRSSRDLTGNEGLELAEKESRKNESATVILTYKLIGV